MTQLHLSTLSEKIQFLEPIVEDLKKSNLTQKIALLNEKGFYHSSALSPSEEYLVLSLKCIGEWERIKGVENLYSDLLMIDQFYNSVGGVIGYHLLILKKLKGEASFSKRTYFSPKPFDITSFKQEIRQKVLYGLKKLPLMTEIYTLGGAADRLHLEDKKTKDPLPAAKLPLLNKGLLKLLIEDVQAREYLYFKIYKKQCQIPICMMTSKEKNNHFHVLQILEENNWFSRDKKSFFLFCQPSVPIVDDKGAWCLESESRLKTKPGGHGVLWKMLLEKKLFPLLKSIGKTKALVRQINNPIAGLDYGLLAFVGHGFEKNSDFGFIGCDRLQGTKEGINVLVEEKLKDKYSYFLSNIEYCDKSISSMEEDLFLSNTNILFCDLEKVQKATIQNPFPGLLINFKEAACYEKGVYKQKKVARLEATMQNISDCFSVSLSQKSLAPSLKTFVARGKRIKTISPAKKALKDDAFIETPEKTFYDYLKNAEDLLMHYCKITVPKTFDVTKTSFSKPSFIFFYHAALGPLYSIISQKIKGGSLGLYSEVILEIAEIYWEDVHVDGSLQIIATNPLGDKEKNNLIYSELGGKAYLQNVTIQNQGVDFTSSTEFWRCDYARKESLTITLEKNAEFYAKDITLCGNHHFIVEENTKLILKEENGSIIQIREKIKKPSWFWEYSVDDKSYFQLKKGV